MGLDRRLFYPTSHSALRSILMMMVMMTIVTSPKLALANPMESLATHPIKPTCDQLSNHPCNERSEYMQKMVNESELLQSSNKNMEQLHSKNEPE
jgi:hypothetical protein